MKGHEQGTLNRNMADPGTEESSSHAARKVALLISLAGAFLLAYLPVWKDLVSAWYQSEEYSHGFIILPVCAFIVWRNRGRLRAVPLQPSFWGLVLVIAALLVYLLAYFAKIVTLGSLSLIPLMVGTIVYVFGFPMLRVLLFPVGLLLFMIPVPSQIYASLTIPLQLFVSKASVGFVSTVLHVPVYREGNVIYLPDRVLQVVQACSGLRSMVSLLALSALYGYFTLRSNLLRAVLLLTAVPASVLVNMIRVILMMIAFYYLDLDLSEGTVHTLFGVLIFFLAIVIIAAARGVLSLWDGSRTDESSS